MHNRLHRTAIRQQLYYQHNYFRRLAQPCKQRALLCTKGFPVGLAPVAWALAPVTHDITLPDLSSCHALQVRAKYLGGTHLLCECLHMHSL